MNILKQEVYLKDLKLFKNIVIGVIYFFSVVIIFEIGKKLILLPFTIANTYNIEINNVEQIVTLLPDKFELMCISIILISLLALPCCFLLGRLKKLSKDGGEFYPSMDIQNTEKIEIPSHENQVYDVINSDDNQNLDEKEEENLINNSFENRDNKITLLKCKDIKNKMLPITLSVTRELYYYGEYISFQSIKEQVTQLYKYEKIKNYQEKSDKIAKSILDFLKKNDIIETDEGCEEKYYFTILGKNFMQYYIEGKL